MLRPGFESHVCCFLFRSLQEGLRLLKSQLLLLHRGNTKSCLTVLFCGVKQISAWLRAQPLQLPSLDLSPVLALSVHTCRAAVPTMAVLSHRIVAKVKGGEL